MADCPVCGEGIDLIDEEVCDDDIDSGFVNIHYECSNEKCPLSEKGKFYTTFEASGDIYSDDEEDLDIAKLEKEYEQRKVLDGI